MAEKRAKVWGFTGTREGMTLRQKYALSNLLQRGDVFHHGDCVGADATGADCAMILGCIVEAHPCNFLEMRAYSRHHKIHPEKPPLDRNKDIVDACECLIAAPKSLTEEVRSGTWHTIRYAREVGKPVIILEP